MKARSAAVLAALLGAGCVPEVGAPASRLVAPRVLAVRSEPAELAPGETARLTLHVAGPRSETPPELTAALGDARWALCAAPRPPVDNNFVSERCLSDDAASLLDARGPRLEVEVPASACALFGPETPPAPPGQPPGRPRDPDATGGYYQPVRVQLPELGLTALAGLRIVCGLAAATPEVAAEYRQQYVRNRNPEAADLRLLRGDTPLDPAAIPVGATVSVRLSPTADSAESFLLFDPLTQRLRTETESLRVSWYSGQGRFALSTTPADASGELGADWVAPDSPGSALLWAVLRDSRGGVAVRSLRLEVR